MLHSSSSLLYPEIVLLFFVVVFHVLETMFQLLVTKHELKPYCN